MYGMFFLPCILFLSLGIPDLGVASTTSIIELDRGVHFLSPGGDVVLVNSGTYEIKASEGWLHLIPQGKERHQAMLIAAQTVIHEESILSPRALSLGGEEDVHLLALFLPNRSGLWAIGSYSGIQSRTARFAGGDRRSKLVFLQRKIAALKQKNKAVVRQRHLLNRAKLQDSIAEVESRQEKLRNSRQLSSAQFENANQKATQYINMLSSVLKTMKEMGEGTVRNLR